MTEWQDLVVGNKVSINSVVWEVIKRDGPKITLRRETDGFEKTGNPNPKGKVQITNIPSYSQSLELLQKTLGATPIED